MSGPASATVSTASTSPRRRIPRTGRTVALGWVEQSVAPLDRRPQGRWRGSASRPPETGRAAARAVPGSASRESRVARAAANSIASGSPSRRGTAGRPLAVAATPRARRRARALRRRTDCASAYSRSPSTRSSSRLVTSTAEAGAIGHQCSKTLWPPRSPARSCPGRSASGVRRGRPGRRWLPPPARRLSSTSRGSRSGRNGDPPDTVRTACSARRASSIAKRVLPQPPAPVTVTSRVAQAAPPPRRARGHGP